jgi:tetratricopeptide (TPR) repeat protein
MTRILLLIPALASCFAFILDAPADEQNDKTDAAALVQKALDLAKQKKYDKALDVMHKIIDKEPNNDRVLLITSDIERRAGRFADGLRHAQAALKLNDKVPLYYAMIAANAYGDEQPELALEYCRKVIALGPNKAGASVYKDAKAIEDVLLPKTYTITWKLDPSNEKHRQFIRDYLPVAVPKDGLAYQSVKVEVQNAARSRLVKGEANDVLQVVPNGNKTFEVVNRVTLKPVSYKAKLAKAAQNKGNSVLPGSARVFLGPSDSIDPSSEELKKVVGKVKGNNAVETVRNILAWSKKNIKYKEESSDVTKLDFKSVDEIVQRGHAECRGYTLLFVALCRAAGIPARPVWGVLFVDNTFKSHNWAEVYIADIGWVPVDPQAPETFGWLPINRVRMFMDQRKTATSPENLPLLNLLFMNGEKLQYEQSRPGESSSGSSGGEK